MILPSKPLKESSQYDFHGTMGFESMYLVRDENFRPSLVVFNHGTALAEGTRRRANSMGRIFFMRTHFLAEWLSAFLGFHFLGPKGTSLTQARLKA